MYSIQFWKKFISAFKNTVDKAYFATEKKARHCRNVVIP